MDDSVGQPVGFHTNSNQATLLQEVNLVGQGRDMGEFERSRFFTPWPLKFRESANERGEARLMVLVVEPCHVPSLKGSLHWEVKEADARAGLETHTSDNLAVSGAWLVFEEKIIFEQGEIRRNAEKCLTEMDEDDDLKNGIRVEKD
jgi:hypothetical protein